jgi:hypothetical protein
MWTTFLGKHIKPLSAEVVLALIPSRICNYQFRNRLDNLTLSNTRMVTFKLVAIKNRCSWFTQLYICASYSLFVFVNCCAFIHQLFSLSFVHLFCSLFDYFVFILIELCLFYCCSKEKEQFLFWIPVRECARTLWIRAPFWERGDRILKAGIRSVSWARTREEGRR